MVSRLLSPLLLALSLPVSAVPDPDTAAGPRFFDDYAVTIDASMYALQKNPFYIERRFAQSTSEIDLSMFSMGRFSSTWWINMHIGLGQTPGNVVFDVIDLDYSLVPTIEYRFSPVSLVSGIDHRCFHEVDRKTLGVAYWNKVFLIAQSPGGRLAEFVRSAPSSPGWGTALHTGWSAQWGFFLKEFFGLVHPTKLNGFSDRSHELVLDGRMAAARWRSLLVALHSQTLLGQQIGSAELPFYWQQLAGIECFYTGGRRGACLYLTYTLDDMPFQEGRDRWGRDRLLEFGVRLFE